MLARPVLNCGRGVQECSRTMQQLHACAPVVRKGAVLEAQDIRAHAIQEALVVAHYHLDAVVRERGGYR